MEPFWVSKELCRGEEMAGKMLQQSLKEIAYYHIPPCSCIVILRATILPDPEVHLSEYVESIMKKLISPVVLSTCVILWMRSALTLFSSPCLREMPPCYAEITV